MLLTEKEKKILNTFEKVLPSLTDEEKNRLLYVAEGMTLKSERLEKEYKKEV